MGLCSYFYTCISFEYQDINLLEVCVPVQLLHRLESYFVCRFLFHNQLNFEKWEANDPQEHVRHSVLIHFKGQSLS